jgi:hypothetical protein
MEAAMPDSRLCGTELGLRRQYNYTCLQLQDDDDVAWNDLYVLIAVVFLDQFVA